MKQTLGTQRSILGTAVLGALVFVASAQAQLMATPLASNTLPANGAIVANSGLTVNMTSGTGQVFYDTTQAVGVAGQSSATITMTGTATTTTPAVILSWGTQPVQGSTFNETTGAAGFNIGSSAGVVFQNNATNGGNPVSVDVLNIDTTGTASQIEGGLAYTGGQLWIANANGVLVGSTATIVAPAGLGLLGTPNASSTTSAFVTAFASNPTVIPGLDFSGTAAASTGMTLAAGATLDVGNIMLVAGSGVVNIAAAPVSFSVSGTSYAAAPLYVVGGMTVPTGGFTSASGSLIVDQAYPAQPTTLNVTLGDAPYTQLYALIDGDINNYGNITVTQGQLDWTGTLTNMSGAVLNLASTTNNPYSILGFDTLSTAANASLPADLASLAQPVLTGPGGTPVPNGAFVNATGATLNSTGTAGTAIFASSINLQGTQNFTTPLYLIDTNTQASTSTITIGVPLTVSSGSLTLLANNLDVTQSVTVSNGDFVYYSNIPGATAAYVTVASGATISANNIDIGVSGGVPTYVLLNGGLTAADSVVFGNYGTHGNTTAVVNVTGAGSITTPYLDFANLTGYVNNVTSAQIAQNGFTVNAPAGTGNIDVSVTADGSSNPGSPNYNPNLTSSVPGQTYSQGNNNVNLMVTGNLTIDSGNTLATANPDAFVNATETSLAPDNANSILFVQASGNVTVAGSTTQNGGNYQNVAQPNIATAQNMSVFQYPGLIYLQSGNGTTNPGVVDLGTFKDPVMIANAYGSTAFGNLAPGRGGVFLLGNTIKYYAPALYTNAGAGVVFAQPAVLGPNATSYNAPATIIGNSPQTLPGALTPLANDGLPTVDFLQGVSRGQGLVTGVNAPYPYAALLQPMLYQGSYTFTNALGQIQQYYTFLTLGTPNPSVAN